MVPVRATVTAFHREIGFDPRAMFARLGIKAELGTYRPLML